MGTFQFFNSQAKRTRITTRLNKIGWPLIETKVSTQISMDNHSPQSENAAKKFVGGQKGQRMALLTIQAMKLLNCVHGNVAEVQPRLKRLSVVAVVISIVSIMVKLFTSGDATGVTSITNEKSIMKVF